MLEVIDLWKSYEGSPLLCGVSFSVAPGETACLLGASGSGKSTILRIIAGLEDAEKGSVRWDGQNLGGTQAHRRHFGLMFQDYALFPHRSVAENTAFGLRMQNVSDGEIAVRVKDALGMVNMESFASRRVTELSGGEQQRVALARALAARPLLLMLDEPLGALDRRLRDELAGEIRQVLHRTGVPAIYVTHDQEEAFAVASQLLVLSQGRIVQAGSPEEVYHRPVSARVASFFGMSNILPGRVVSENPVVIQTAIGRFSPEQACLNREIGQEVNLLLRPDGAAPGRLDGELEAEVNTVRGAVLDAVFQGQDYRVDIQVPEQGAGNAGIGLRFILPGRVEVGDRLSLRLPPASIQCLE